LSDKIEAKNAVREFFEKQQKLMKILREMSGEMTIEFHLWFMTITGENFKQNRM
jgi:hypothetical protein